MRDTTPWPAGHVEAMNKMTAEGRPAAEIGERIGRTAQAIRSRKLRDRREAAGKPRTGQPPGTISMTLILSKAEHQAVLDLQHRMKLRSRSAAIRLAVRKVLAVVQAEK